VQRIVPARAHAAAARAFVGESAAMRRVQHHIEKAAATDCNVLVVGETGTGKELAAGLVHELSARAHHPFVAVNCAAIPDALLESELFGHDRGAFTGAVETCEGKLRQADKGTLFLDEVGDMSLLAQAKVLRAFESRTVVRVGGRTPLPVDVRFVAATNMDLTVAWRDGRFRSDLFYRLNVAEVNIPPLRERPEDIRPLIDHYVRRCNQRFQRRGQGFSKDVILGLEQYAWPGNVRELRNVVEATFVNSSARWLTWTDLPIQFRRYFPPPLERALRRERDVVMEVLVDTRGNKTKAAKRLHCSRMSIYRKLAKYAANPE
jgi:transcriptional regulator with PAS, ATPase and Fis domain